MKLIENIEHGTKYLRNKNASAMQKICWNRNAWWRTALIYYKAKKKTSQQCHMEKKLSS